MDTNASTLKAGDVCLDCQQEGLAKHLRFFKINLNGDTLLKCESDKCMYPYNEDFSSSEDDDDEYVENSNANTDDNSLKFIEDLIQQFSNDTDIQNSDNNLTKNTHLNNQAAVFDITFLDNFVTNENEELSKPETLKDNKCNFQKIENPFAASSVGSLNCVIPSTNFVEECGNKTNDYNTLKATIDDSIKDCKTKINIESIETIKLESIPYDILPIVSNTKATLTELSPNSSRMPVKFSISFPEILPTNSQLTNEKSPIKSLSSETYIPSSIEDSLKDFKPKIDIQSIETVELEPNLYNVLPTVSKAKPTFTEISTNSSDFPVKFSITVPELMPTSFQLSNDISSTKSLSLETFNSTAIKPRTSESSDPSESKVLFNSPLHISAAQSSSTITSTFVKNSKPSKKSQPKAIKTKTPKSKNPSDSKSLCNSPSLVSAEHSTHTITSTSVKKSKTSKKSQPKAISSDIPKANIISGSEFLKKIANFDDTPIFGTKPPKRYIKKKIIEPKTLQSSSSTEDKDYSCEKLAAILNAKKIKSINENLM